MTFRNHTAHGRYTYLIRISRRPVEHHATHSNLHSTRKVGHREMLEGRHFRDRESVTYADADPRWNEVMVKPRGSMIMV